MNGAPGKDSDGQNVVLKPTNDCGRYHHKYDVVITLYKYMHRKGHLFMYLAPSLCHRKPKEYIFPTVDTLNLDHDVKVRICT